MNFLNKNRNKMILSDGLELMRNIPSDSISACFFDPQYRQNLDKLNFGNEGKSRQKKRSELPQMDNAMIFKFLLEIERVLIPSGYLFFWGNKFMIGEGTHKELINSVSFGFHSRKPLNIVDVIIWDKGRIQQGMRTRNRFEPLFVYQKNPKIVRPKGAIRTWTDRGIPDLWNEVIDQPRSQHPHKKPLGLISRLIRCVTIPGDYVLDPCAGSGVTMDGCVTADRHFIGGDILKEYANAEVVK